MSPSSWDGKLCQLIPLWKTWKVGETERQTHESRAIWSFCSKGVIKEPHSLLERFVRKQLREGVQTLQPPSEVLLGSSPRFPPPSSKVGGANPHKVGGAVKA